MAKRTAQKRKASGFTAANRRKAVPLSHAATFGRPDLLILLGLAVMTFAIYAQVAGHQFITLDDPTYIQENPMVNRGISGAGLAWAFTTFYATNWHPLTWISHMIDCQLFGMKAGRHLLVNALIHVGNTLLVFWFLLRATHARWPSALVAALFALHPLHVESVAWASERKDTLSTFFGLLSLIAYTRYVETRFTQVVCRERGSAWAGSIGQTDAGDVAFRHVAARLLAVQASGRSDDETTSARRFPQGSGYRNCARWCWRNCRCLLS